jgi:HAE1 family hydrophobic/amphiphilic exporter-1
MKSLVRWAITNTPAMNTLMVAIMAVGVVSLFMMNSEVFPEFELEIIQITVPYPGASPAEVEEGICQKIEEAVQAIDGIKKLNSMSREGSGTVVLELHSNVPDVQKILNEVRSEIDRIPSFPELAEDHKITQITLRNAAIRVGVIAPKENGPETELELREVTERIRRELLQLESVSQATIIGGRDYQIDIEIPEATLRQYGLTLKQVADIVRRENIELPGGKMRTDTQEILLRGKNKQLVGSEIARIPLVTQPNGVVLTVGDLGTVRDEFVDTTAISRINGRPGLVISVDKTASEDLLAIVKEVREYLALLSEPGSEVRQKGYEVEDWADRSAMVADRMDLLGRNGLQGLILVFIVLAVFLERRLAYWVALGIPISMLGACAVLWAGGQTLNMLSMFAFLMVLGILVDDAIVVGENVYTHRQMGKPFVQAAVDGTYEVLPSVMASVTTTVIAFTPLLFVPGVMGKFIAVMPLAVIVMLIFSLFESTFILPCHLAHSGELAVEAARPRDPRAITL